MRQYSYGTNRYGSHSVRPVPPAVDFCIGTPCPAAQGPWAGLGGGWVNAWGDAQCLSRREGQRKIKLQQIEVRWAGASRGLLLPIWAAWRAGQRSRMC
jgi:hypothetical protein